MLNTASNEMAAATQDSAIPVIQVTEPVSDKMKEKSDIVDETENVLQMIIDQQKAKRKKFIFREGGQISGSVEDKGIVRGDSSDSEYSSASATSAGTAGDQN